jgi:lipopolysaccharide transport system ATP-binding protein
MSDIAIRVDSLGKQYRIGGKQEGYRTLRETLTDTFVSPFRRARKLLQGHAYGAAELDETIWALRDVSLEIKRGEVVGIIGPNGAGKTTLLKILSRITEPTEGQAEIRGRVGSLLEVGTGFHQELTGRENIYLNAAILGMKKTEIECKFDEIVAFAEIERFLDTPVKHYSSGMYVRLAFAVAAHLEPDILLVDEVLAVGDAAFQKKCIGKMGSVAEAGRTVLFVSHNMAAIQGLCKTTMVLEGGRVVFRGETTSAITRYLASTATAQEAKVSLIDGTGRASGCEAVLREVEIRADGKPSTSVGMGETLEISVSLKSGQAVRKVGIVCEDTLGRRLFVASTQYHNPTLFGDSTTCAKIICSIPDLRLVPGVYYVSIYVAGATEQLDKVEQAVSFTVIERDVFKTGTYPTQWKGLFYSPAVWRLESFN